MEIEDSYDDGDIDSLIIPQVSDQEAEHTDMDDGTAEITMDPVVMDEEEPHAAAHPAPHNHPEILKAPGIMSSQGCCSR